ncbi:MAG: TauD/TfdA family dioxygenase [Alphaproteobacteria bacterium]
MSDGTIPLRKVGGKAAWRGPDIADSDEWKYHLSPDQRREILAALRHYQKTGVGQLDARQADFPLPTVGPTLRALMRDMDEKLGIMLVRGMPLEGLSQAEIHQLYWGVGLHLGVVLPQSQHGELIGDIRNRGTPGSEARGYTSGKAQSYHTDEADVVLLLCRQRAKAGGASKLASTAAIHDYMVETRPDLVRELYKPHPLAWVMPDPVSGERWFTTPFFGFREQGGKAHFASRFSYNRTLKAQSFADAPRIGPKFREAVEYAFDLANDPAFSFEMYFEPGDLQFVVNYQIIHGRTDVIDHDEIDLKRHVMRMWLSTPYGRPLPHSWKHAFTSVEPGTVRGGVPWWWFSDRFGDYRQRAAADLGMIATPDSEMAKFGSLVGRVTEPV